MAVDVTPEHLQGVFCHENTAKRKLLLAEILDFGDFDEEDDFRTAILLDVYYENLLFAVNHGFPWSQVCSFFNLIRELLKNTKGQGLKEAIDVFTESLGACSHQFSENNLKSLIDYIFSTFFQHYKLYQYVLTRDREEDRTKYNLIVQPPPLDVPSFGEGVPKSEWDERERLKEIDEEERRRNQEAVIAWSVLNVIITPNLPKFSADQGVKAKYIKTVTPTNTYFGGYFVKSLNTAGLLGKVNLIFVSSDRQIYPIPQSDSLSPHRVWQWDTFGQISEGRLDEVYTNLIRTNNQNTLFMSVYKQDT